MTAPPAPRSRLGPARERRHPRLGSDVRSSTIELEATDRDEHALHLGACPRPRASRLVCDRPRAAPEGVGGEELPKVIVGVARSGSNAIRCREVDVALRSRCVIPTKKVGG